MLGARQGLQCGFYLLAVNGTDVRAKSIRAVTDMIRNAGRPLTMEFGCVELDLQDQSLPALQPAQPSSPEASEAQAIAAQMKTTGSTKVAVPAAGVSLAATPKARKPAMRTMTLIFGKNEELGLVLGSEDPLDQMWLQIDKDGDGELGRDEVAEILRMMNRSSSYEDVSRVMAELDSDRSDFIDIGEFEEWYTRQPDRKVNASGKKEPVFVVTAGEYAAGRGVRVGAKIVSVQGKDMRQAPLREVMKAIQIGREGTKRGKVMKMVIERLTADHAPTPQGESSPASRGHNLLTVTLQKDKKDKNVIGWHRMELSPNLRVKAMPRDKGKRGKNKPGPAEKAGVQIGQLLVSINGKKLNSIADAAREFKEAAFRPIECVFRTVAVTETAATGSDLQVVAATAPSPVAATAPVAEQCTPQHKRSSVACLWFVCVPLSALL